jgi:SAM-dependent methyltransferase
MTTSDPALIERLYANYDGWKGWEKPFFCPPEMAAYYAKEMRGRSLCGCDVLEIGFGNGEFLGFARDQGARITGSEITPAALDAAKSAGIALISGDFEKQPDTTDNAFDIIAAFDVFEHLEPATIVAKLSAISRMLRPDGWLVLRYPNGQSPFGLGPQHADATHVTALSRYKIEQYASGTDLHTIAYSGVARPASARFITNIARTIRLGLRDCHMAIIRFLYATDIELEPVVTHLLAKRSQDFK